MRVACTNCGGDHPTWDCKRPAKKSTAAQKVVLVCPENTTDSKASHRQAMSEAGTQALPVDTNSKSKQNRPMPRDNDFVSSGNTSAGTVGNADRQPIQKRPRGRPKSITDMPAYKAAKQREYRAKWKGRE